VLNRLFAPFPVAGNATYPVASGPGGVDITAKPGTQVIASLDGTVHLDQGAGPGGRAATLTAADGTTHIESHLDGFAPELVDGQHVSAGDPIGTVGAPTAPGDTPRAHFEIHPAGGAAVDPCPQLDQWLSRALINAQALTGRGGRKAPIASSAAAKGATKNAAAVTPGAATMIPGLGMVGFGVWLGSTRLLRRRRASDGTADLAVEFAGPVDFASKFVIRPPAPGRTPQWQSWLERQSWLGSAKSWVERQSWLEAMRSRLRERRFKWW
jgi:murein DD-endopeptidase MepM/ murein hydrolase activator NlpD